MPQKRVTLPPEIRAMLRVNQAGEYGATCIYAGQLAVLKDATSATLVQEMRAQEHEHLRQFNQWIIEYRVRPTVLQPLWVVGGYALGVVTGVLGEKAVHACTKAVEEVIDDHYQGQQELLNQRFPNDYLPLKQLIRRCHEDEIAHKQQATAAGKEGDYPVLTAVVKTASKIAIWLSTRL